jgi:hypothetical protein
MCHNKHLGEELTSLSIVTIIHALVGAGRLVSYRPTVVRAPHPQGPRQLWLTPETYAWCSPAGNHPDSRVTDDSLAHLGDQLNAFVLGEFMDYRDCIDIRRLCPDERDIWEIKSHLKKPQLRVLGWFVLPKLFVGVHPVVRDDLEKKRGPKWDAAIAIADHARTELVGAINFFRVDPGEYVRNPK